MKVCIIGVYFGVYPDYFDLWLKTCQYNSNIDFYIVGDAKISKEIPNVHHIYMTLKQFKLRAEKVFNTSISLEYPFKCCDYKPLYGLIINEYIRDYDYWGYCDFDMLFGDIMYFLEKYNMSNYDKFLPLGHLSFIRNTDEVNRIALGKGRYLFDKMISSQKTVQFDELGGINQILLENNFSLFQDRIFADISRLWKRIKLASRYQGSRDVNYKLQLFYWKEGKVFRSYVDNGMIYNEEYIYIHLKKRKYKGTDKNFSYIKSIIVTPDKLEVCDQPINILKEDIKRLNPYKGALYELLEEKFFSRNTNHIMPKG